MKLKININSFRVKMVLITIIVPAFFMLGMNIISGLTVRKNITTFVENEIQLNSEQVALLVEEGDKNLERAYFNANESFDTQIRDQVYSLYADIEFYYNEVQEGRLNTSEAQILVKNLTNNKRYGEELDQYFWIYNSTHHSIAHGTHPERYGLSYSTSQTAIDFVDMALNSNDKEGYVFYAQVGTNILKKAFVKGFEPWGWAVCTGTTLANIESEFAILKNDTISGLKTNLAAMEILDGGYIAILDNNKSVIYHPDKSVEGTTFTTLDEISGEQLSNKMFATENGFLEYGYQGDVKLMYVTHVEGDYLDYYVFSAVTKEAITSSVRATTNIQYIVMGVGIAIMIAIGLFFAQNMSNPIIDLTSKSKMIANQEYVENVQNDRKDEIGELSVALGEMVKNIQNQIEYNRAIIDTSPNPQILLDEAYNIVDVNVEATKILGISKDQIIGEPIRIVFGNSAEYEEAFDKIRKENKLKDYQMTPKSKQGTQYRMLSDLDIMNDKKGNFLGYLMTFSDITSIITLIDNVKGVANEVSAMAQQLSESSNQINISIQEITSGSQDVARGAQHQTQSVNQISNAVSDVQNESQVLVSRTLKIATESKEGQEMAQEGKTLTSSLANQIEEINRGAGYVAEVMGSLSKKSSAINKIVDVISGIATETNLLALNAAIEAARAGDAGKGFAVVAEQVRKLAEDSKQAADQINELINAIQTEVSLAVSATDETVLQVKNGKNALEGTSTKLDALFEIINKTDLGIQDAIQSIKASDENINEIASNVQNINAVIEQSSGTAQELSSSTEEMASTLEEMSAAAEELNAAAERLFIEVDKI
ncbi:methyl-accepting chemotaxis protein [Candidatus Lokiarchaeum ossiferum]|uniref:methyl-accepting chemotaxis protein n=1 Tax=Candidatus Lokiarchaeum ossiferum TaxID=2951803 RepID=UPI00352FA705